MLHRDEDSWPTPQGAWSVAGGAGRALDQLAREIEETQRRQSDTLAHIVERLRALDLAGGAETQAFAAPGTRQAAAAPHKSDEPWDAASAEALMQTYEADAARPQTSGEAVPGRGYQDWLGQHFDRVTERLKTTLSDLKPGHTVGLLEERLDQFQRNMALALEDVVRRADLDGLRRIEAHASDLDSQLNHLERQVQRLDGIEADVRSVLDQVSDERIARLLDSDSRFAADLEAVALRAAEEMHQRLGQSGSTSDQEERRHQELRQLIEASIQDRRNLDAEAASLVSGLSGRFNAQDDRYDEIKALLESSIKEQRENDQNAFGVLDTLQQAMVRLLDRMDAFEQQHATPPPLPARAFGAAAPEASAPAAFERPSEFPAGAMAGSANAASPIAFGRDEFADAPVQAASAVEAAAPFDSHNHGDAEPDNDGGSTIERLRRDFIADARRAKMKAAANRAEAVAQKPEATRRGIVEKLRLPAAQSDRANAANGSSRLFGASPKLLASVLAVVVAINGALLLLNRKNGAPPPVPEITLPSSVAPNSGAPANDDQSFHAPHEGDAPEKRSSHDGEGSGDGADTLTFSELLNPDAAEGAIAETARPGEALVTPYGVVDDILNPPQVDASSADVPPVPLGTTIARPMGSMPDDAVADVYEQQVLAGLSGQLGNVAAKKSADALLPERNGRIDTTYAAYNMAPAVDEASVNTTGLDLPPATVGPLSLRLAAANGDASAEFEVGARLAEGKGTDQNFVEAMRWYQRSAAKGFAQAQYRLGTFYERGFGVPKDLGRARAWYVRAAEQGNVKAMHNLAVLAAGAEGEPDYKGAMQWFIKAAEHGLADSQYNLGVLLENGLGTKIDRVAAYKWYALAAKNGDNDANAQRDVLKGQLPSRELARAEKEIAAFKPRPTIRLANDPRAAGEDWKTRAANFEMKK